MCYAAHLICLDSLQFLFYPFEIKKLLFSFLMVLYIPKLSNLPLFFLFKTNQWAQSLSM